MSGTTLGVSRWLAASASVFVIAVATAIANGCGGIDCTETATCPGAADAAPDQRVVDVTLPPNGPDASIGPEAQPTEETGAVAEEPVDMGDAEPDAFDATLDAADDVVEEPAIEDAELSADVRTIPDARADAADAQAMGDGCVNRGGPENCTNGIDDNCDGLIDCADPQCVPDAGFQGYTCVPSPPSGWVAPVVLYDFTGSAIPAPTPPSCGSNYPVRAFVAHDQPSPPASTCTCTCGGVSGASCTSPTVTFYSDGCNTALGASPVPTSCTQVLSRGGINGIKLTSAGSPSGGGCDAGVASTIPTFDNTNDWLRTGGGCTTAREHAGVPPVQGGCAANQVCVENPPSSLGVHMCVALEGSQSLCGAANGVTGYDAGFTYYESDTDTRVCSGAGCNCGSPSLTCTPTVTVGNSSTCNSQPRSETTTCDPTTNYPSGGTQMVWAVGSSTPSGGSCAPTGSGTLNGGITKTGVVTVCCVQ
ncbi:MAG TPA: hypothetical protein VK841_24685 [Polyangiaceae bacterium]|jgi:hypothetical protein|nr:hypothetical protein [Polyangiaceae bacterium]